MRMFDDPRIEGHLPRPFGVFYETDRPCYEEMLNRQIDDVIGAKGKGDLDKLLRGNETWSVPSFNRRIGDPGWRPAINMNEKEAALCKSPPLFYWFFHSEIFSLSLLQKKRASDRHRRPVLTSETTKRKTSNIFSLIANVRCSTFPACSFLIAQSRCSHLSVIVTTGQITNSITGQSAFFRMNQ